MKTSLIALAAALAATGALAQDATAPAAPAGPIAQAQNDWYLAGQGTIEEMLALQPNTGTARNVILLTSDGNGVGTNYAVRLWMGQQAGGLGDDFVLPYEAFPDIALVKTYSTNGQTPDSAPTASAMNTGVKTKNDIINITDNVAVDDCAAGLEAANQPTTLAEIAAGLGKSVGVVSTARITHATPAAVYAHSVNRDWESDEPIPEGCDQRDIATQLMDALASGEVDLALGGGREHFLPAEATDDEGDAGARTDGQNLVEEFVARGGAYASDDTTFAGLPQDGDTPVLGLFESSHMQYEHDRTGEPSLEEMTRYAIDRLSRNPEGYYLSIEGGRVDHANHAGNLYRAVTDGAAFAAAVQAAMDLTDPADTLIIVTADHEHAIAFNGYCGRGSSIVGLCMDIDPVGEAHTVEPVLADDGKPYTVAGYLNGAGAVLVEQAPEKPADDASADAATTGATAATGTDAAAEEPVPVYSGTRPDLTDEQATDPDYLQQALIPLSSETHSGEDVAIYARGPWSHLVGGTMEQNVIFHVMLHAMAPEGLPEGFTPVVSAPREPQAGAEGGATDASGAEGATPEGGSADQTEGDAANATGSGG